MQNSKSFKFIILMLVCSFVVVGCTNKNEDFGKALSRPQDVSLARLPKIMAGLPFYSPHTLSPFWADTSSENLLDHEHVSMPEFKLQSHKGEEVTRAMFLAKNTVVAFLFTTCAGFCPTLVEKLKEIEEKIADSQAFQFVAFTVDPEVDTPEVLKKYMERHNIQADNWTFVTGEKARIHSLIRDTFASEVRRLEGDNMRKFAHTEHFYILDKKARLRSVLNGTRLDLPEKFMRLVSQL